MAKGDEVTTGAAEDRMEQGVRIQECCGESMKGSQLPMGGWDVEEVEFI